VITDFRSQFDGATWGKSSDPAAGLTSGTASGFHRSSSADLHDYMSITPVAQDVSIVPRGFARNDPKHDSGSDMLGEKQSLMEKLRPDTNYQGAKGFVAADNMRNVNQVVKDGQRIAERTSDAKQENEMARNEVIADFKQAQTELQAAVKDSAVAMGHDAGDAVASIFPGDGATKISAAAVIGVDAATGGSFKTMGQGATIINALSDKEKRLDPKEQEAILEASLKQLQSAAQPADTRMAAAESGGGSAPSIDPSKSENQWENLEVADLKELAETQPENLAEVQALDNQAAAIDMAQDNQRYVAENYGRTNQIEKGVALADSGQGDAVKRELQAATVAIDAPAVELAGAGLNGIVVMKVDPSANDRFYSANVTEVATMINPADVNTAVLERELTGHQMSEMRAAF